MFHCHPIDFITLGPTEVLKLQRGLLQETNS